MKIHGELIYAFMQESNLIEGILRAPTEQEVLETQNFLDLSMIDVQHVNRLVFVYQPDARLRNLPGLDVRVGNHIAPRGGPAIEMRLANLLSAMRNNRAFSPYDMHCAYEDLHPYTDGNGRSGRAIWAWQMVNYHNYRTLDAWRLEE